ncbi:MAG TPA: DUF1837 domain-containing protein, partial [Ilumatobacteraceae bacterium]|nr:DUF1837 domain-containing protein [Ilumatobacteraceae bacterium]
MIDLAGKLAEQAVDYCVPRSRVEDARRHLELTGSADRFVRLSREASELFTSLTNSGEGGELLLFLLLERVLGVPQLLCKMSLKTNSEMHVHGTDGVHVKVLDNGRLGLYWCESKLYDDPQSAVRACFDSIAPFLLDEGNGAARRDLLLLRDHLDTGDDVL